MLRRAEHIETAKEEIIMRVAIALGLLFGAIVLLPAAATAQFAEKKILTLKIARKVVAAAEAEAVRNHLAGVVAVVDDGGWPILIERTDHAAYLASMELAPGKAALFKKPSQALEDAINQGRVASRRCKADFQSLSMAR
jgi:glc operon protein GlcG